MPLTAYPPHRMGAGLQMATRYPPHACGSLKLTYSVHENLVSKTFTTPSHPLPLPPPPVFHRTNCYPLFIYPPAFVRFTGKLIVPLDIHISLHLCPLSLPFILRMSLVSHHLPIPQHLRTFVHKLYVTEGSMRNNVHVNARVGSGWPVSCLPSGNFHLAQESQTYKQLSGSITGVSAQSERRYCKRRKKGGR